MGGLALHEALHDFSMLAWRAWMKAHGAVGRRGVCEGATAKNSRHLAVAVEEKFPQRIASYISMLARVEV